MVRYTAFLLAPVVTAFAPSSNLFPSRVQRLAAEGNDAPAPESENMVEDGDVESVLESSTGGEHVHVLETVIVYTIISGTI